MDYKDFTVVLPTLNEAGTIGTLIRYLRSHYKGISVTVADDGSTDGTKRIAESFGRVKFLDRKKMHLQKGLAASVIDGINGSRTRFVIVMDADLQHPPKEIARIAAQLAAGCDLSVASRASAVGWELDRKIISKLLIYLGYFVLLAQGSTTCGDIFSGYFGLRRDLFVKTYAGNRERFVVDGYKILFDFIKCIRRGSIKVGDVPFDFQIRKMGKSKAGMKQGFAVLHSFFS